MIRLDGTERLNSPEKRKVSSSVFYSLVKCRKKRTKGSGLSLIITRFMVKKLI